MSDRFVRSGPCPQCQSLRTLTSLNPDGTVFMRLCQHCAHEWDKSDACEAVERMTARQFDRMLERDRAADRQLNVCGCGYLLSLHDVTNEGSVYCQFAAMRFRAETAEREVVILEKVLALLRSASPASVGAVDPADGIVTG